MTKKYKVGDIIHLADSKKGLRGGGQIYQIVGVNSKFLLLSYETIYGYGISARVSCVPIEKVEQQVVIERAQS